jgi:hypothetical protein
MHCLIPPSFHHTERALMRVRPSIVLSNIFQDRQHRKFDCWPIVINKSSLSFDSVVNSSMRCAHSEAVPTCVEKNRKLRTPIKGKPNHPLLVLNRQIVLVSMATEEVCDIHHHYPCMDAKICGHAAYALYCYSVDTCEYPFTCMAMGGHQMRWK